MKREIKFRCFHPRVGMRTPDQMWEDSIVFTFDGKVMFDNYVDETHNWKLMQYTGLKDSNGVEIYEGDILQCKDDVHPAVVQFDEAALCWSAMTYFKGKENELMTLARYVHSRERAMRAGVEVIGNIHENPELLEVKS